MPDDPFYAPNHTPTPPRPPKPGEEVWRLTNAAGEVQRCELYDHAQVGAGWDVVLLEGDELLLSRRCSTELEARYVADPEGLGAHGLDLTCLDSPLARC